MKAISLAGSAFGSHAGQRADVRRLDRACRPRCAAGSPAGCAARTAAAPAPARPSPAPRAVDLELAFPDVEGGPAAEAVRHGRILSVGRRDVERGCRATKQYRRETLAVTSRGGRLVARLLRRFQVVQAVELLLRRVPRRAAGCGIAGEMFLDALECFLIDGRRLVLRARDVGQAGLLRVRVGQPVAALFLAGERRP